MIQFNVTRYSYKNFFFKFQFSPRRDRTEQDGSAARRRSHHVRNEVEDISFIFRPFSDGIIGRQ